MERTESFIITKEVTQKELDAFLEDLEQAAELEFASNFFSMRITNYVEEQTIFPAEMNEENCFIFARLDHQIVGLVWLGEADCEQFPDEFEIELGLWDLYVLPNYRGKGIATKLYQAALQEQSVELKKPTFKVGLQALTDQSEYYFERLGFVKAEPELEFSDFFYKQELLLA